MLLVRSGRDARALPDLMPMVGSSCGWKWFLFDHPVDQAAQG
jgi:hypothetical protein